ncbi:Glycoside hydrolase [Pseudozyma hubeiensis]|nr:Glycoside hydrolase [Pseudozyma hubeiensis]
MSITPNDYNNNDIFMPILEYNGNASSPFTLDSGTLGPGPEGVLLQLRAAQQAKISTTDYFMYGYVEATLRHNARQGLVAAFILMSDVKDEVDWELVGSNSSQALTNYFSLGVPVYDHAANVTASNFNVSDWHTYGLNWTSSQLQWSIDSKVVRTLTRAQAGKDYPQTPSRIQLSTWAGGNETNPQGTIDWAGGLIDWDSPEYKAKGFYSQEIKQFNIQCASLGSLNVTSLSGGNSSGGNVTSFGYTGGNFSSSTGPASFTGPAFGTSTDPLRILSDPGADGIPGYPGYGQSDDKTGKNSKDGKDSNSSKDGDKKDNNDDAANSSSVSTSDALKYALPISGAIVGIAALWAIIAFVRSRHLKAPVINAIGVTGVNDSRFTGPSYGAGFARSTTSNVAASAYQDGEHEPGSVYRNEPNMNLMMGGGIMSDAGLNHLQRQTTGGSRVSRSSSRSVADRLLGSQGRGQRYQQLDATLEEEAYDAPIVHARGSSAYRGHAYEQAAQEEVYDAHPNSYYNTPTTSPVKSNAYAARGYYEPAAGAADTSFEACQLQSPQRRTLPITPYTPNYAFSPTAPPRPSGRMYDTPNVNYYPTPVMMQSEAYTPVAPLAYGAAPHNYAPPPMDGYHYGGYVPTPPPRRH